MKNTILLLGALLLTTAGCEKNQTGAVASADSAKNKLFLDVHELGPGKVSLAAAAQAHAKDLATQGKYGADFKAYWVDEKAGKIYCLVEAPSAETALAVHKEAHGLMPTSIEEVSQGR